MKKLLIITAFLAIGYKVFANNNDDTPPMTKARTNAINGLFTIRGKEFAARGITVSYFNKFSDAELTQILNVVSGAIKSTPEYVNMLKSHNFSLI